MKIHLTLFFVVLILISCNDSKSEENKSESEKEVSKEEQSEELDLKMDPNVEYKSLDKVYYGMWVGDKYLNDLREYKSPRKAQQLGNDHFYLIHGDQLIYYMTAHEGTADNKILMTSDSEGVITILDDSTLTDSKILFKNEKMYIDNESYINVGSTSEDLNFGVSMALMDTKFKQIDADVILNNCEVIGGDYISYKFGFDYYDAGLNLDRIYFRKKGQRLPDKFVFEFVEDTLVVYSFKCVEMDELNQDLCLEVAKDTVYAKFVPVK